MKRYVPWAVAGVAILWLVVSLMPPREQEFSSREFGRLPVLLNGRVQPLDSVARNALLQLRHKQSVRVTDPATGKTILRLSAIEWLKEVMFQPELADTRPTFRIDHPEVLGLLKIEREDKNFSLAQIRPGIEDLEREARRIGESGKKPEQQTAFEKAVMGLYNRVLLYQRLKTSLKTERMTDFGPYLAEYEKAITSGSTPNLMPARMVAHYAYPLLIPGDHPGHEREDWSNAGNALLKAAELKQPPPEPLKFYARMNDAFRAGDANAFNQAVTDYRQWLAAHEYGPEISKGKTEHFYNRFQGFYRSMFLYVGALLLAFVSWFNRNEVLRRTGVVLAIIALVVHTAGLGFRMYLEGRPPVTNLYSSAIFIGWGTVILGLLLERFYRDGIGLVVGALTGFVTLVIAHNLAMSGDTMEMLQAVLDTNFWLATHVVVVTLGYSATFFAGFLAVLYIIRGFFTTSLTSPVARALSRMVYGVVCFATLFSFVGTVLGGIWADQSWGRFWGWDPKENGALLIVLWNAFYLHARWGKIISEKGLMATAVFGNVITAFSWFGVNMLGIGLHSYGFMDAAFKWLMLFNASQLVLIALALTPLRYWRSFRNATPEQLAAHGKPAGAPLIPRPKTA